MSGDECLKCNVAGFLTVEDFLLHHSRHVGPCRVQLSPLSSHLLKKIEEKGFLSLSGGVAKKSTCVSPLKISLKKRGRKKVFKIVPRVVSYLRFYFKFIFPKQRYF